MVRIGRTVLALEEPVGDALARIESAPDEPVPERESVPPPPTLASAVEPPKRLEREGARAAPLAVLPPGSETAARRPRARWSAADLMVMAAAIGVLALSIAGLVWLLRG